VLGATATYVPVDDAAALAAGIEDVLGNPDAALGRVHAARERFLTTFTSDRVADQTVAFYERALRQRKG
jgi:glycosyltransferase involved in cell wall biosynthesis